MNHASAIVNMEDFMDRARERQRFQSEGLHVQVMETLTCLLETLSNSASDDPGRLEALRLEVEGMGYRDARHLYMVPSSELLVDMQRLCGLLGNWVGGREGMLEGVSGDPM